MGILPMHPRRPDYPQFYRPPPPGMPPRPRPLTLRPSMSLHWPIIRSLLRNPRRILITDDSRTYRGMDLLVGAFHIAGEIARRCSTPTVGVMLPTGGAFPMAALAGWIVVSQVLLNLDETLTIE